jgi:hypothetical protein
MEPLRVLCVHGIGNHQDNLDWQALWKNAINAQVAQVTGNASGAAPRQVHYQFVMHDKVFDRYPLRPQDWARGLATLAASGAWYGVEDWLTKKRDLVQDANYSLRWYAGMVAQWSSEDKLRAELRKVMLDALEAFQPDLLIGHSLGSLITYDTLVHASTDKPKASTTEMLAKLNYMTLGSQIGNPTVRGTFGGRIVMPDVKKWFQLYNPLDHVFTASVKLVSSNFQQLITRFDEPNSAINHNEIYYFSSPASEVAWRAIAAPAAKAKTLVRNLGTLEASRPRPKRRALIVGINEYANPAANLEGCVNDAFLMSSVLQELGFEPEDIRMVLDQRATAAGLRERLEWLLDDVQENDIRFFHYSGHGAQMPGYGADEVVDRLDECLVPYDFDWTPEKAILDNWFYELYSQLPYSAYFFAVLDCCHSGGLARAGGVRVRGIDPPDDIRHRALRWNAETGLWEPRQLAAEELPLADDERFGGDTGAAFPLGSARQLRKLPEQEFDRVCKTLEHRGPFMPIIYEACGEEELAEEYRHGATPHGAFTFAMAETLRRARLQKESLTFQELIDKTALNVKRIGSSQHPAARGPSAILKLPIPVRIDDLPTEASPPTLATASPPARGRKKTVKKKVGKKKAVKKAAKKKATR